MKKIRLKKILFKILTCFNRSAASDFVISIVNNLCLVKSLDTLLYFSKTILMLLMDDEQEIRERNTNYVMQLIGEPNRKVVAIFAQEQFINFIATRLINFEDVDRMALILHIFIDGSDSENSLDVNIADYQVFDKNEVNIFGETFIIKKMCLAKLKEFFIQTSDPTEKISLIVEATQQFFDSIDGATVKSYLENLL